jgi:DeoR/GlpR family transcriptional regulator of sugar metabolism
MKRPMEEKILLIIRDVPDCTYDMMVEYLDVSRSTVKRAIKFLTEQGKIERIEGKRYGYWKIKQ